MTSPRPISSLLALLVCACGGPSTQDLALQTISAQVTVAPSSGVADQLGGAMLIDASGQPVRVRADGSQSTLESHPSNPAPPGFARALWALGPHSALVAAGGGLYLAQNGWLIAPPWRDAVPTEGVVGAADALDGTAWIGHRDGLFRLSGGQLAELKLGGSSATGLTHLAFAVNAAGKPSLWFARPNRLGTVTALGDGQYEVKEEGLPGGKTVQALVALGPSTTRPAELWLLTDSSLHRFVDGGWKGIDFGKPATSLVGAGRSAWISIGDRVLRFDADTETWNEATGVTAAAPLLLAADAAGTAWLASGEALYAVSEGGVPRIAGIDQNQKVFTDQVVISARFPEGTAPTSVDFALDDGVVTTVTGPDFSFGGLDHRGSPQPVSLAGLSQGMHRLTATAAFADGKISVRTVPFDYRAVVGQALSWATDIAPIFESRCARCHDGQSSRPLDTYQRWVDAADKISAAVGERRMPADGPLDPELILTIQRWVAGGTLP